MGALCLHAQKNIRGTVTDAITKAPLAGATISFPDKGGTTTDRDGRFSMECGKANRITVSFLGYTSQQQIIRNCDEELRITLVPSSRALNEVEITATSNPNKSLLYQPVSITKLGITELKRGTGLFLDDAINASVPGVLMQRRTVSAGQQFNIRGYGNGVRGTNGVNSNFDVQGTKIYLNGIPVTDAEGITLLDDIDFGSIGNVEVTKGPSGTLYGLAIAGVVNLKTIRPEKGKTSIGQDVLFGSYGLRRYTTHFEMGNERSSLLANYGYQHSDGFMAHTGSRKKFVNLAGDFQLSQKQSMNFYAGYSDSYDERGGELTLAQFANRDYSGNPAYIQRNGHSNIVSFRLGVGHTYNFNDHISNTTTVFGSGVSNNSSSAAGWTDKDPINYGFRSTIDTKWGLSEHVSLSGITGIEAQRQNAQVIGYNMKADPANPAAYFKIDTIRSNQQYVTGTRSLFTEWTATFPKDLGVTAGVGWSTMDINLFDRFVRPNITRPQQYRKNYKNMVSPHFAINKVFSKELSVYASYSQGYKAPVSSYFFVAVSPTLGFVDSTLKPERGHQFEVGSKGALFGSRLVYQLAFFDAVFSNKMTAVAVPLNPPAVGTAYTYVVNGGRQNDKGMELLLKYVIEIPGKRSFSSFSPFVNFAYSKFRYEDFRIQTLNAARTGTVETDYSGKAVAGVAPVTYTAGFDFIIAGLYGNCYYSYRDKMPITSDGANKTKSFGLLNAKLGFRHSFSAHVDLDASLGANNITGTQYYNMVFVNQLPDAYLPAPRNTVFFGTLGVKYNF